MNKKLKQVYLLRIVCWLFLTTEHIDILHLKTNIFMTYDQIHPCIRVLLYPSKCYTLNIFWKKKPNTSFFYAWFKYELIERDCGHAWCFYMLLFLFFLDFYLRTNNIPPAIKHGVNVPATIYTLPLRSIFYLPACIRAVLWCKGGSHSGRVGSSKFQLKSKKK